MSAKFNVDPTAPLDRNTLLQMQKRFNTIPKVQAPSVHFNTPANTPALQLPQTQIGASSAINLDNLGVMPAGFDPLNSTSQFNSELAAQNTPSIPQKAAAVTSSPPSPGTDYTGMLGAGGQVLQGVGDIANAYMAWASLDQAKKQFKFDKKLANRNIYNQGTAINNEYTRARKATLAGQGLDPNSNAYKQSLENAKKQYVNTSKIG